MSLAAPRRRRKNPMHTINLSEPNHWTNDNSKFGQKMLEKFGWTKGSGLGKNQQGISENIRVQHKIIPTGLGYVAHNADDWFKAGEEYSRLLSQLTKEFDEPTIPSKSDDDINPKKSLVQNSLNSKSRVHYHKFTKGKDLTQYKKQELACILGKGSKDEDNCTNGLDMKEYFKTKRESKTNKHNTLCDTNSQTIIHNESNEGIVKTDIESTTELQEINFVPQKKRKRESKLSKELDILPFNENDDVKELKKSKTIQNNKQDILCNTDCLPENSKIVSPKTDVKLKTELQEINFVPQKKRKRESKLSKELDILPFNENNDLEEPNKIKTIQNDKQDILCNSDCLLENNKIVSSKTDVKLKTELQEINFVPQKKRKRESKLLKELDILPFNENDDVKELKKSKTIQNNKQDILCITDCLLENNKIVSSKTDVKLKTELQEINFVPQKKRKRESKLSKELDILPFNENDDVKELKKSKTIQNDKQVILYNTDCLPENNKIVSANITDIKLKIDVCEMNQEKRNHESKLSKEINIVPPNEFDDAEHKNKSKLLLTKDNDVDIVENYNSECNNNIKTTVKEQYTELVLAQLLIDNSSASKKYCKDSHIEQNDLFEKKIKEFSDNIKHKTPTTIISTEIKPSYEELMSDTSKTLNPNDKDFVRDFEIKKSEVLKGLLKHQELNKHMNTMSMFIAKHGDVLFFGSNINDIKGYGNVE